MHPKNVNPAVIKLSDAIVRIELLENKAGMGTTVNINTKNNRDEMNNTKLVIT